MMRTLSIVKMFFVVPIMHLMLLATMFNIDYWYWAILLGILIYYPIHQNGQSIGYHKMFSHRSFEPVAWFPFVSTFCGIISFIGCPMVYSVIHRMHHRYSDSEKDPHSPKNGLFHAYVGWIATYQAPANSGTLVADILMKYRWLHNLWKYELIMVIVFYATLFSLSQFWFCVILLGSLLSLHTGFAVNAFSHRQGTALDSEFFAKWINPVFMHKFHHDHARTYNYSQGSAKDFSVPYIEKILIKK